MNTKKAKPATAPKPEPAKKAEPKQEQAQQIVGFLVSPRQRDELLAYLEKAPLGEVRSLWEDLRNARPVGGK